MALDLPAIASCEKMLSRAPEWSAIDASRFGFTVPLDHGEVTVEGLQLRGSALREIPDREVMFQLEVQQTGHRLAPISRVCWNPVRPHNNRNKGPLEFRQRPIVGSHCHPFELNYVEAEGRMVAKNLRVAVPLEVNPANFEELVALIGELFRIRNMGLLISPPYQDALLL